MTIKDIYRRYKCGDQQFALSKKYEMLYAEQRARNGQSPIQFYNWWHIEDYSSLWLYQFVQNSYLMPGTQKQLNFCSMFDERGVLKCVKEGVKVFFSGENIHHPQYAEYADGLLGDEDCQLSLGFDYYEDKRYMRFPLWLTYVFEPTIDEKKIRERCKQLRHSEIGMRKKFACLIARADISGVRTEMYEAIKKIGQIDCPSDLFHNDDSLTREFADDKIAYMRQFAFNICPENSNAYGYCTEKVFEAIAAGCIPIYWGTYNQPEPTILNPEAIIFWDRNSGGKKAIAQIDALCADKKQMEKFLEQPRLIEGAEDKVMQMMNELYGRLRELV